jgi:hypothetical protein
MILLISASHVARIIGMSYQHPAQTTFLMEKRLLYNLITGTNRDKELGN